MRFTQRPGRFLFLLTLVVAISAVSSTCLADSPSEQAKPDASATSLPSCAAADNAWILVSSALVLMMTAPGLALFYCGLVRKKNVLSVMMQCIFMMCLMTVVWAVYGYSLVFGGKQPWIGDFSHLLMRGVDAEWTSTGPHLPIIAGKTLYTMTHMIYQGMFFIITPALICGAFAERMKFSTMVVFMVAWGTFIYCPLAHWLWGDGGALALTGDPNQSLLGGAIDFAGGTVVHISSGVSALVCALMLGKRLGYGKEEMRPHNLTYMAIGAAMLWVGWFGFNAGSALSAGSLATCAFAATHFAAASGGITWAALEWFLRGKPSVLGVCSGLVAGLATITQAAGFVTLGPALLIGMIGATVCYSTCTVVKVYFGYDDSLDVFGVHGVAGTLGAILTGIFATRATGAFAADPKLYDLKLGLLDGGSVWKGQLLAAGLAWAWAILGTFVILKVLDIVMGLRVSRQAEIEGLDLSQHGEEGYIFY